MIEVCIACVSLVGYGTDLAPRTIVEAHECVCSCNQEIDGMVFFVCVVHNFMNVWNDGLILLANVSMNV